MSRTFLAVALAVLAASNSVPGQPSTQHAGTAAEVYVRSLGFGASELRAADEGEAVARLLETEDNRDVAVFGMIRVRASRDATVAHALALRGVVVTGASRFGVFSNPPVGADVSDVRFDRSEYKKLRSCRPGHCAFKLSAQEMTSYLTNVEWSLPNAKQRSDELLRDQLLRLVAEYGHRGDAALPAYDDGHGVRPAEAFAALMTQSGGTLAEQAPELLRYLTTYPSERPDGAYDFMY